MEKLKSLRGSSFSTNAMKTTQLLEMNKFVVWTADDLIYRTAEVSFKS